MDDLGSSCAGDKSIKISLSFRFSTNQIYSSNCLGMKNVCETSLDLGWVENDEKLS